MEQLRLTYFANISINRRKIERIIIDQHYKIKHPEINDLLILNLIRIISGKEYEIEGEKDDFFIYQFSQLFLTKIPID